MPDTLLIRFAHDDMETVTWLRMGADGEPVSELQAGLLTQAAEEAEGCRIVVLVPGTEITLTEAEVPSQSRQRVQKAIPYALEENLVDDIENLHFVTGPRNESGSYPVAVVARAAMDAWLEALTVADLSPQLMLPDTLAVPCADGRWSLLLDSDLALLRTGQWSGLASEPDLLPALLDISPGEDAVPRELDYFPCADTRIRFPQELRPVEAGCEDDVLQVLARGLIGAEAMSLLAGPYSRREQLSRLWRPWRSSAALLVIGVVLFLFQFGLEHHRLSKTLEGLTAEIEGVYREAFPAAKRVVDPRAQMKQKLETLRRQQGKSGADFLHLLAQSGSVLRSEKGIEIRGASFRDGRLDVELEASNLQVLDQLKQQLTATGGLKVEIQSATASAGSKVQGRLRIQGVES